MSSTAEELVDRGMAAFISGDMATARDVMAQAVDEADAPYARLILGGVAYSREDYAETQAQWEAAFRTFKETGDLRGAALTATYLGSLHYDIFGNESVSRGWLQLSGFFTPPMTRKCWFR